MPDTPNFPVITHLSVTPSSGPGGTLFRARVLSAGQPDLRLAYRWFLDGAVVPGATGASFFATTGGVLAVEVVATDAAGASVARLSDGVLVSPGVGLPRLARPVIEPPAGQPGTVFAARVDAGGTPAPDLAFQWFLDGRAILGASAATFAPQAPGSLAVRVTATNSEGIVQLTSEAAAVAMQRPPTIGVVRISPEAGRVGDSFESDVVLEGDEESALGFQWFLGDEPVEGASAASFVPDRTGPLFVRVTATGPGGASLRDSETADVLPPLKAPRVKAADILPSRGKVGDHFVVVANAVGEPSPEIAYQWFIDGEQLPEVTGDHWAADRDGTLFVRVIAQSPLGTDARESGAVSVEAAPAAPRIEMAAITGGPRAGDVFQAQVTATGVPAPAIVYQWLIDGVPVPGAHQPDFVPAGPGTLALTVSAANASGEVVVTTAPVAVLPQLRAPAIERVEVTPQAGRAGERFAAIAVVTGEPAPALSFRWFLDGAEIPGADAAEIAAPGAGLLGVEATAANEAGRASAASAPVRVEPALAAPVITRADLTPSSGRVGDIFTVSGAAEGVPQPVLRYTWFLDGTMVSAGPGTTFAPAAPGTLTVSVQAENGAGTASRMTDPATVNRGGRPARVTDVAIAPAAGIVGDTFRAVAAVDGDPVPVVTYQWMLNGAQINPAGGESWLANAPGSLTVLVTAVNEFGTALLESAPAAVSSLQLAGVFAAGVFEGSIFV